MLMALSTPAQKPRGLASMMVFLVMADWSLAGVVCAVSGGLIRREGSLNKEGSTVSGCLAVRRICAVFFVADAVPCQKYRAYADEAVGNVECGIIVVLPVK